MFCGVEFPSVGAAKLRAYNEYVVCKTGDLNDYFVLEFALLRQR